MATSEVEIANSALRKLGAERITALTDSNVRARLANDSYETTRDNLLRAHPWHFCTSYVELAAISPLPSDVFEYDNVFQLPSDCLRVLKTDLESSDNWEEIEGRRIACNTTTLKVKYIKKITDVTKFDANFTETLAWFMAADMAYSLTQSNSAADSAMKKAESFLATSRSFNAQVGSVKTVKSDDWVNIRR